MAKRKTEELTGAALDYAVAAALGLKIRSQKRDGVHKGAFIAVGDAYNYIWRDTQGWVPRGAYSWSPSTRWEHGGPLIEHFNIDIEHQDHGYVVASIYTPRGQYDVDYSGPDALTTICRAVVAAKFGREVEIPDELLGREDHAG